MVEPKATTKKAALKKTTKTAVSGSEDTLMRLRSDLLQAQKSHASGELVNPHVLQSFKKDIARELTKRKQAVIKERSN